MQRPKDTCVGARAPRGKISFFSPIVLTISILSILLLIFLGFQFRNQLFPKPLTLASGRDIKAKFTINAVKPFHVGDLLPVTLEFEARNGVTFQMPELEFTGQNQVDLKHKSDIVREKRRGGYSLSVNYLLTSWDVAKYNIPVGPADYKTANGKKGTYQSPNLKFEIVSLLPKNKSSDELLALPLKPAKKPMGLPPKYQYLWWSLIGLIIIGVILLAVIGISKIWKKKTPEMVSGPIPPESAHIIALRRLEALLREQYPERGEYKAFYSELSECIREYMENRFQIRALEMTTEEFLDHLTRNSSLKYEHRVILEEFLRSSDFVKFAKHIPSASETDADFGKARHLIEETKEVPVVPEEIVHSVLPGDVQ